MKRMILFSAMLVLSLSSYAEQGRVFNGILHSDRHTHRASLETPAGIYELDFQGFEMYRVSERHDRKNVVVEGSLSYSSDSRPVLIVDRITFRPNRNAITYDISARPRHYVERQEPERYSREDVWEDRYRTWDRRYSSDAATSDFIE